MKDFKKILCAVDFSEHSKDVAESAAGTHGRKGLDRILFGSVAEKVVKSARQPVLTIRPSV